MSTPWTADVEQLPSLTWARDTESGLYVPRLARTNAKEIVWAPQEGSQRMFLSCPIFEVCYEGTRGPGKTDTLLQDFAQHVGKDERTPAMRAAGVRKMRGWGEEWRGILFRRTYPELQDVVDKSKKYFPSVFPGAVFNESRTMWRFPDGEVLFFRQFGRLSDYWSYHGHAYPWMAWEELGTWPDDRGYKMMMSCARSKIKGIPIKVRSTTNPFGPGHNFIKHRFRLPAAPGKLKGPVISNSFDENGVLEPPRVAIHGELRENKILLTADPEYPRRLVQSAPNAAALEAWLFGSWDIVSGGMFDDIWFEAREHCVVPNFVVPDNWRIDRSFDWGDTAPFSVGWWAESNGEDLVLPDGKVMSTVRGDLFRIGEWYGWTGRPNEGLKMLSQDIAAGIVERELKMGIHGRVRPGPADSSIFTDQDDQSVAKAMARPVRVNGRTYSGVRWVPADKSKGSRINGWQAIRSRLSASISQQGKPRELPGLFITRRCTQWLRTVPVLPRDEKTPSDVDSSAEDHVGDECRYRIYAKKRTSTSRTMEGLT